MTAYRPASGQAPCGECPFRRRSAAGWLGEATPQSFISEISLERPLPCHPTIDYDDPAWLSKWMAQSIGRICAGSLIMSANMGKLPRDPAFPRLPPDDESVFANHLQFIAHHEGAEVRSWELAEDAPREVRLTKKTKVPEITIVTEEQLRRLICHTRIGRQNAYTRAIRNDAHAVLDRGPGPASELLAKVLRDLASNPEAIGVYAVDRSPMNKMRWVMSLFCGHVAWATSKSAPSQRLASCEVCRKRTQGDGEDQDQDQGSAGRGNSDPKPAPDEPRIRRFSVRFDVEIDVDQRLIDAATDVEWRETFYDLQTSEDVAGHLAYNLVQGSRLTSLDGFADQADDMAKIWEIDYDPGDIEEIKLDPPKRPESTRRPPKTRPTRPAGRAPHKSAKPRK